MSNKKLLPIMYFAIAALALIFAITCFALDTNEMFGMTEQNQAYGGDAYTGIQNAAAQAATNTYYVGQNISNFAACVTTMGGFAFVIAALAFATVGWTKWNEYLEEIALLDALDQPEAAVEETPAEEVPAAQ